MVLFEIERFTALRYDLLENDSVLQQFFFCSIFEDSCIKYKDVQVFCLRLRTNYDRIDGSESRQFRKQNNVKNEMLSGSV